MYSYYKNWNVSTEEGRAKQSSDIEQCLYPQPSLEIGKCQGYRNYSLYSLPPTPFMIPLGNPQPAVCCVEG